MQLHPDSEAMGAHEVVDQPAHLVAVYQSPPQRQQQHAERAERSNAFDDSQAANGPVVGEQQGRLESDGQRRGWRGGADPSGYEFTERDWGGHGTAAHLWNVEKASYAKGKVDAEKYGYAWGKETGIDVVSNMPSHVLGPVLNRTQNNVWQKKIGQAQRLMATSSVATNGSRYILGATDESGELTARQMRDALGGLYPDIAVGGDWQTPDTPDFWHAKCTRAIRDPGLKTHPVLDTLRATGDSLVECGAIELALK